MFYHGFLEDISNDHAELKSTLNGSFVDLISGLMNHFVWIFISGYFSSLPVFLPVDCCWPCIFCISTALGILNSMLVSTGIETLK